MRFQDLGAHALIVGADGAFHGDRVGQDVVAHAAMDGRDRDDRRRRVGSSWRLTMVCNARMICAEVTTGSMPRHGCEPCVWRPSTSILRRSALAISPPGRSAITPERMPEVT